MVRVFPDYRYLQVLRDRLLDSSYGSELKIKRFNDEELPVPISPYTTQTFSALICKPNGQQNHHLGIFYGKNPLNSSFTLLLLEIAFLILIIQFIRFLLKPFKQPRVVAEIIGGIIVGPSVLGRNKNFGRTVLQSDTSFIIKNIGLIGFMYYLFITGVKMDMTIVKKSGRKQLWIASVSTMLPLMITAVVAFLVRESMDPNIAKISSIGAITSGVAITMFPVLYPILQELNLLSSDVGRMALSMAIISDTIGLNAIVAFEAVKQGEGHSKAPLWYLISVVVCVAFVIICLRRVMEWIIAKTPAGEVVGQGYIVAILLGVLMMGFLTDMFGIAIANGPLWLGLIIPDGPPLGATLVDRSETIIMEVLMPFAFAFIGLHIDVVSMGVLGWESLMPLFVIATAGYFLKFVSTVMTAAFFEVPFRDSLTLGLILSLRGQVELIIFMHWIDKQIIGIPHFTMMVLLATAVTAIATPLISILYDPTRPYMVSKRRTIQHTPTDTELRICLCIYEQETVSGLVNLLDISNPTTASPFAIYALRLVKLVGRAAPVFIDHQTQEEPSKYAALDSIHNALKLYAESRVDLIELHSFTAVAPEKSMYQDICKIALLNKTSLIILPFHKAGGTSAKARSVNYSVLTHAPCSVGVFVDKGNLGNPLSAGPLVWNPVSRFAVLFLGGADAREALALADRMAGNQEVSLTVLRFLSQNSRGDDEREKKLDDGAVTRFWVKNESNKNVVYKEVVVRNGAETVAAIHAMNDNSYDLWIVGRKNGINPMIVEGLSDWSENHELGIIGDFISSLDFGDTASTLVVQQQVLRDEPQRKKIL